MARDWQRIGEAYYAEKQFATAWELYHYAARVIVDRAFTVSVTDVGNTAPPAIISPDVAAMLGPAREGAVEAAKDHLAFVLSAAAFLEDLKDYGRGGDGLRTLLEEAEPIRWTGHSTS